MRTSTRFLRPVLLLFVLVVLVAACQPEDRQSGQSRASAPTGQPVAAGWQRLPDPPLSGRIGATVVGLDDGRAAVVGGWEWLCPPTADCTYPDRPLLADGAIVDLRTGEWEAMPDAPYGFVHAIGAFAGGDLFLLTTCRGGPGCDGAPELLRYDVAAARWRVVAGPRDGAVGYSALVPVGDRLLAVSGSDERGEAADQLYDPATDRWEELPDDPLPEVFDRFAVAHGDRILAFGSIEGGNAKLAAAYDLRARTWSRLPDAPSTGYQAWRVGDEVWLNGHFGRDRGARLDLGTDTWRPLPDDYPAEDRDLAGVVGDDEASYEYDHGWVRDLVTDRWVEIPDRAEESYDEALGAVGSALLAFGGQDWEGEGRLLAEAWVWCPDRP